MIAPMRTLSPSRRATALGLVMTLSLVGCSRIAGLDAPSETVGDATYEPSATPSPASPSSARAGSSSPTPTRTPAGVPTATPASPSPTPHPEGCSLLQFHGHLAAENGRPVFRSIQHNHAPDPVPLDWPDGWTIRPADGEQFEVLDRDGFVRARTGTRVILLTPDYLNVHNRDGEFIVCDGPYGVWLFGEEP
jgi:hypothetical protein